MKTFSLVKAINGIIANNCAVRSDPNFEEYKINKLGEEVRAFDNSIGGQLAIPGNLQFTQNEFTLVNKLKEFLNVYKAGARLLTEQYNDFDLYPYQESGSESKWSGQIVDPVSGTFPKKSFSPYSLSSHIKIDRRILMHANEESELYIINELMKLQANAIEKAIFSKDEESAIKPTGLFSGISESDLVIKGTPTFDSIVSMEESLDAAKTRRTNRTYFVNGKANTILKKTPKITGQASYLLENEKMNSYPTFVSDNIPGDLTTSENENGIVFGNFSDFQITQYGVFFLTVDPFIYAMSAEVKITIASLYDFKPLRSSSFVFGSIA